MAGMSHFDRRTLLGGVLTAGALMALASCNQQPEKPPREPALAREEVSFSGSGTGSQVQAVVWAPSDPRGVVLLAANRGERPERYEALVERLGIIGLAVIAPTGASTSDASSAEDETRRGVAELGAAALYANERFARLPVMAVGHGTGSLSAMALGGALAEEGDFTEPTPRGVIAFSAPPGTERLAGSDAVAALGVPVLLVAGSEDPLPVDRLMADGAWEADAYALILAGGGPDLVYDTALVDRAWSVSDLFVQAYLFGNAASGDALEGWRADGEDRFIARRESE